MRSTSTQEAKVLAAMQRSNYLRVKTKNAGGASTDLTALRGYNWVVSATWSEEVDQYVGTAEVDLQRENQLLSLANLAAASVLNSGGPLIEIGRELTIETATMPLGIAPGSSDWHLVFHGYIDEVDWEATPIKVTCRDLGGLLLQDSQIEVTRDYGVWEASRAILVGQVNSPSGNPPNGQPSATAQFWKCTTAGTTGATEPAWPASPTPGATVSDNGVVWTYQAAVAWAASSSRAVGAYTANPTNTLQYWQCTAITTGLTGGSNPFPSSPTQGQVVTDGGVTWQYYASLGGTLAETVLQELINDTLGAGVVTLSVPASSNWFLGPFEQQLGALMDGLTALTEAMGFDLRFAWNQSAADFLLTLLAVPRSSPSVVWTFASSSYYDVDTLSRAIADIRNAVSVVFPDSENLDPTSGQPTRGSVVVTDATSIGKYKRRYMQVAEDATGSLTTLAMATVFANAALSDLKEPLIACEVLMPYFWAIQLNDYVTLKANGVHFDSDQSVAVVSIKQTFEPIGSDGSGKETTTLGVRGLPSSGKQKHLDKQAGAAAPNYSRRAPPAAANLVVSTVVGGASVAFTLPPTKGGKYKVAELHVSTTFGFTPSTTTLKDWGLKNRFEVSDLTPGTTYYAYVVQRDQRGNIAVASPQQTFIAGALSSTMLSKQLTQGFHVEPSADVLKKVPNSAIAYATQTVGSGQWSTSSVLSLPVACSMRIHGRVTLRQSDTVMAPGARAQLQMIDNSSNVVAAGPWCQVTIDSAGVAEINAEIDTIVPLAAGTGGGAKTYSFIYIGQDATGAAVTDWLLKAPSLSSSPPISGSYIEGIVIPTNP